ncbi:MAG: hypothetical protein H8E40_07285 [Chloroflexi bacterium]|nr:hypothetical protein [Chloroflexota bacterium]
MSADTEIVINLDAKRIFAIILISGLTIFSVSGYISALLAFVAPSEDLPIHVNSAVSVDVNGTEQASFARGSVFMLNVTVEMATQWQDYYSYVYTYYDDSSSYLLLVRVVHDGEAVFLGFVADSISSGDILSRGVGFLIDETADTGTYTAYVYIWSYWLPDGIIMADNSGYSTSFTVTA